jgi:hypothetical protein
MKPNLLLLFPLCLSFCSSDITVHDKYDFSKPSEVVDLPMELMEVSGISYVSENVLACVEDEDAVIYYYDLNKKKIIDQFRFGQAGDYEDLVVSGKRIYVLKSDGDIFSVLKDEQAVDREEIKTGLSKGKVYALIRKETDS